MSNTDTKPIVAILVTFLTVVGTIVTAYFGYLALTEPHKISLAATQTAAVQYTAVAQILPTPVIATTIIPTLTEELIETATPPETIPSVTMTITLDTMELGIGNWIIIVGSTFRSLEGAHDFVCERPYSDYAAQVFQKDGFYRPALVGFDSERQASEALRKIVDKGGQGEIRNLVNWCKDPISYSGYMLCQ